MEQEATYIKGFNAGYKLAEFNPELWEKLKPSLSHSSEYEKGVLEGADEFEKSKEKNRTADIQDIRNAKDKGRDLGHTR